MAKCNLSLKLKNSQAETERLCRCVEELGRTLGLSRKTVFAISLAIEELFTNIVSYAFSDGHEHIIGITFNQENRTLVIRIEDDGAPFNPESVAAPNVNCPLEKSKVGGLGIHLAREMVDEFRYQRQQNKNIIVLKKHLNES